jgi:hypothetical protein
MTTSIEKTILRRKILETCIRKQQLLIHDFRERIRSLIEAEGLGNEESYDNTILAANQQKITEVNSINEQLEFVNGEMQLLENMRLTQDHLRKTVSLGAVVVTNRTRFFVSASIESFEVEGVVYAGISANSPIFLAMKGKKTGESFRYNKITYKIKDIF